MRFEDAVALGKSRSDCSSASIDALVRQVKTLADQKVAGCIVELGSYKCGATICLAAATAQYDEVPRTVYGFDLFGGLPYGENQEGFQNFADADFEEIQAAVASFPNIELVRGLHEETIPVFAKQTIALLFLDSDFYESHRVCLEHLWPLVSEGGAAIFHDWSFPGVQRAVAENGLSGHPISDSPNMGIIVKQ